MNINALVDGVADIADGCQLIFRIPLLQLHPCVLFLDGVYQASHLVQRDLPVVLGRLRLHQDVYKRQAPGLDDEALAEMRTLCSRALRAWGAEMQSVVAAEELSELQKELCKSVRGEDNADAIAEEIADVQIMLEQMLLLHDCRDDVDEWRRRKLERLEQRLPKVPDRSQCNHAWVLERTDGSTRYYYCEKCGAHHKQVVPQKADAAWE